jgi:surfactin synthase thioesterase subunit
MFPGGHFYLSEVGRALVDEIVRDLCPAETPQAPRLAGAAI